MIIFIVSAADRESFNDLPRLIDEKRQQCSTSRPFTSLIFITKYTLTKKSSSSSSAFELFPT